MNFPQKMHREKLYKSCMIEFLFPYSNGFSYTQNEQLTWRCHLLSFLKIFRELLWLAAGFGLYKFCRAFDGHIFLKNSIFHHFSKSKYMRNKKALQHEKNCKKKLMSLFFLIDILHFKLYLMFNVNIPKDAARSGLSFYI